MPISPASRKLALTGHILSSIGWMGAALAYLAFSVAALMSKDPQVVRAAYLIMLPTARFAIIPLAFASVLSGLISALGTSWGLFRQYWVVSKLLLTLVATAILLGNMRAVEFLSNEAAHSRSLDSTGLQSQILHSGGGFIVLLVIAVLGVYKPKGMTPYGWRKHQEKQPK